MRIFFVASSVLQGIFFAVVDEFLSHESFFLKAVQNILKSLPSDKTAIEFLANVVARKPELFAEAGIFEALSELLLDDDRLVGALKLMAIITSCKKGVDLAANLELLFASVVTSPDLSDCCATDGVTAFKHCLMHQESLNMPKVLWSSLIGALIAKSYTKCDDFLQQAAIQALRVMSDKPDVKKELCRVYKSKIREIPCLSPESKVLKDDLVQWLDYRNYKPNKPSKYSKLFI